MWYFLPDRLQKKTLSSVSENSDRKKIIFHSTVVIANKNKSDKIPLRVCVNFIAHIVSTSQSSVERVDVPPNKCSLLGQLHLVIDTLFLSCSRARASHYFRLHVYLHNRCRFLRVWNGENRTKHMYPRDAKHTIEKTSSDFCFSLSLSLSLSHDAFIFAKSVLTSFMIRSVKKSWWKKCFNRSITFVDDSKRKILF